MSSVKFRYPEWADIVPSAWVQQWNDLFLLGKDRAADDRAYKSLIDKKGRLSGADFEQIGRWKTGCWPKDGQEHGLWKPQTSAAYDVWMQATQNPPQSPATGIVDVFADQFLREWSERTYLMRVKGGEIKGKRFGLSYATALLHFMSVGSFPIYDDGAWYELDRLGSRLSSKMTVDAYMKEFCPAFASLASKCRLQSTDDLRKLDNALRCYGRDQFPVSAIAEPGSLRGQR